MKDEAIKILLVEDNPDHVILTKAALEENNMANEIYVAKDGQEALDFMYNRGEYSDAPRPGLILLDLKLPKVSGFEVLKQLKNDPQFKSIPIIILTTSAEKEEIAQGYAEGANSYITKPIKFDEFVSKIKNIRLYWVFVNTLPKE
jgi:CheY-like chemotaxis protein